MRLYFFPALLPLGALLPGLLAAVGALAGAIQGLRQLLRGKRRAALALFALAALAAVGLSWSGLLGFRRAASADLPRLASLEALPPQNTQGRWQQLLPRAPLSNLAVSVRHGLILFGTRQNSLDAIRMRDGTLAFSLALAEPVLAEPLVVEDRAYVGEGLHDARSARLTALELPSGKPLWQQRFASHVESMPRLSADGRLLVGCAGEAGVFAIAASTGKLLWQKPHGHCDSTPWIEEDGSALFALTSEGFLALQPASGEVLWRLPLPGLPWGTIEKDPASGNLHFTTGQGQLGLEFRADEAGWAHAVSLRERTLLWTRPLPGMPLLTSALVTVKNQSMAIHALKTGEILGLAARDGALAWKARLPSPLLAPLRRIPGRPRLLALAFDGTLTEIDAATGALTGLGRVSQESTSAPAFAEGRLYLGTRSELIGEVR